MKKIDFMLTAFRDGFQSVFGGRVFSKDYLPVVEEAKKAGIKHFESGGGALFQTPFFYNNENAFDVMDSFRQIVGPDANLQTLARGVNVVGLESQPRDIIKLHAELLKKHGITTIRNFDALNDVNNLIYSGQCIVDAGLKHEVTITMMELPPGCDGHTPEFYDTVLRRILDAGIPYSSVCFKDASGTSTPSKVHQVIKNARKLLGDDVRLVFHTHETAGCGALAYVSAIEAGVDQIDLSMAPVSGGTCQTDVLTMWHALRGTDYTIDVDYNKMLNLENTFKEALKDYFIPPEATKVEPVIPLFPMPGGALTANTQMLRDNNLMDRYPEIIAAMGDVVRRGGFGTSVTPVSQFYFQQAFNNVMFGPWKNIAEGYGKMLLGYFGKTPVEPDAELVKIASEQLKLEPTTEKVLDINEKDSTKGRAASVAKLKENNLETTDENIFIVATCKDRGIDFLLGKGQIGVRKIEKEDKKSTAKAAPAGPVTVMVNGRKYTVDVKGDKATVNGKSYAFQTSDATTATKAATTPAAKPAELSGESAEVLAPLTGVVFKLLVEPGTAVEDGDAIMIVEAMKMETQVSAHVSGILESYTVAKGDKVETDDVVAIIKQ